MKHLAFSPRMRLIAILFLGTLLFLLNAVKALHCGQETGCVDMYWANLYLISFSDGYQGRVLVGQLVQYFFHDSIGYIQLNLIAFAFVLLILSIVGLTFALKNLKDEKGALLLIILLSGPTATVFFEVLGDALQAAFILVLGYIVLARHLKAPVSLLVALVVAALAILTHEASIFLLLPAIYLAYCAASHRTARVLVAGVIVLASMSAFAYVFNAQGPYGRGLGLVMKSLEMHYFQPGPLLPLGAILSGEFSRNFGSAGALVHLAMKLIGVFLWPLLFMSLLAFQRNSARIFRIFLFLLIPSLPLFAIAHDWGRFVIYTLVLSVVVETVTPAAYELIGPKWIDAVARQLFAKTRVFSSSLMFWCLFPVFFSSFPGYREEGIPRQQCFLIIVCLLLVAVTSMGRGTAKHGEPKVNLSLC